MADDGKGPRWPRSSVEAVEDAAIRGERAHVSQRAAVRLLISLLRAAGFRVSSVSVGFEGDLPALNSRVRC